MNTIDFIIMAIVLASCLFGLIRGLTRELLSLVTWACALFVSYYFYAEVALGLHAYIRNPVLAATVSFILIFLVALIVFSILSSMIASTVRSSMLGGVDRSLGFLFGVIRGVVVLCLIEIFISLLITRPQQSQMIQNARFTPLIRRGADNIYPLIPQTITQTIQQHAPESSIPAPEQTTLGGTELTPSMFMSFNVNPTVTFMPTTPSMSDPEQTANALSQLQPSAGFQENEDKPTSYHKTDRRHLDRLIQITEE